MKKIQKKVFMRVLALALFFLIIYFFRFIVYPLHQLKILNENELLLTRAYLDISENKMLFTQLITLNKNLPNFPEEREQIITKINDLTNNGQKNLDELKLKKIYFADYETAKLINHELKNVLTDLIPENKQLYLEQKSILEEIITVDKTLTNLYLYYPELDIGQLEINSQKEEIIERSSRAVQGLEKVEEKVKTLNSDKKQEELITAIENSQLILEEIVTNLEQNNLIGAANARKDLINYYPMVKEAGKNFQLDLLQKGEVLEFLAKESNLIFTYQGWIEKIKLIRKEIKF